MADLLVLQEQAGDRAGEVPDRENLERPEETKGWEYQIGVFALPALDMRLRTRRECCLEGQLSLY